MTAVWALVLAVSLVAASGAAADFSSGSFSYNSSSCSSHVDPITLVFYGYTAGSSQSRAVVQSRTGWGGNSGAGDQYGISHGFCTLMDGQSFSRDCGCDRQHIRYNQTHHQDALGRYETVATPHQELWKACGHVVIQDGFNVARGYVLSKMSPPYSYSWQYWGNWEQRPQCNGTSTSADGWTAWVNIG